ncbi:hypothetical protein [Methylobacterium sp. 1030]|uniref:hypothetical protein n=1 Tax=Methylobacterium sp. 1030 TaxID=3156404 RepID=UPI0033982DD4
MTTENDPTQAAPAPGADAPQQSAPSADTQDEGQTEGGDNEAGEGGEQKTKQQPSEADKIRHAMQKRFDKVYSTGKDWERRATAAEQELAKLKGQQSGLVEPKPTDFEHGEDDPAYWRALGKYESQKEVLDQKEADAKKAQDEAYAKSIEEGRKAFEKREAAFAAKVPDYDAVLVETSALIKAAMATDPQNPALKVINTAIMHDDDGPAIAYHLGQNPDLFDELMTKTPFQVMRSLAKIGFEQSQPASAAPAQPTYKAPPEPLQPVNGRGQVEKNPDKMTMDEWLVWRRKNLSAK